MIGMIDCSHLLTFRNVDVHRICLCRCSLGVKKTCFSHHLVYVLVAMVVVRRLWWQCVGYTNSKPCRISLRRIVRANIIDFDLSSFWTWTAVNYLLLNGHTLRYLILKSRLLPLLITNSPLV